MPRGKFRKDFTPKEYLQYLENQVNTDKYLHDGLESWEIENGVKEGKPIPKDYERRNENNRRFKLENGL